MNTIKEILYYLRRYEGLHISRKAEAYIIEELEDDLFPYGYGDGSYESVCKEIREILSDLGAGRLDLDGTIESRIIERYEILKKSYTDMLIGTAKVKDNAPADGDLPF